MTMPLLRLADLCDFVGVQVDPTVRPDGLYVGLEHVASGRFVRAGEGKASDVQSSKYAFLPGDVLYGKLRPYLDKAVLADDAGICTTELLVLRPKDEVDPRFLVAVAHAHHFIEHADLHKRKRAVLDEIFKTLLHKLVTGEIRVADLDLSALTSPKELAAAE